MFDVRLLDFRVSADSLEAAAQAAESWCPPDEKPGKYQENDGFCRLNWFSVKSIHKKHSHSVLEPLKENMLPVAMNFG